MSDEYTGDAVQNPVAVEETVPDVMGTVSDQAGEVEYIDLGTSDTIPEESVETSQPDQTVSTEGFPTEDSPAKDAPQRMAYWQSKTDKATNENNVLRQEMNEIKSVLGSMQQSFSAGDQNGSPQGNQFDPSKEPTQPQRPTNYNEVDAFNDPDSESFRYRTAKDQYQDNMMDYLRSADTARQEQSRQQMAKQEQQMVMRGAYDHVHNNYGWDNQKSSQFVDWAMNPENVNMDVLAKVYDATHSPNPEQARIQNKAQEMKAQQERLIIPRTTTVESGETPPPMSEQDVFNAGLLSNKRR